MARTRRSEDNEPRSYSLGGVVARYALGILDSRSPSFFSAIELLDRPAFFAGYALHLGVDLFDDPFGADVEPVVQILHGLWGSPAHVAYLKDSLLRQAELQLADSADTAAALSEASSSSLIDAMEAERIIAGLHGWHTGQRETFSTRRTGPAQRTLAQSTSVSYSTACGVLPLTSPTSRQRRRVSCQQSRQVGVPLVGGASL
jgi:hypothetical protein